jgi:hypothetical protein
MLDTYKSVTLNASGNGTVTLAPDSFRTWIVETINVRTSQGPTQTPIPQVTVYLGSEGDGQILAQTWNGSRSTATGSTRVQPSQPLIIKWENGRPGSTATASIFGTMEMR